MERVIAKFSSFEEADKATIRYYHSLSPAQRLDILSELVDRYRKEHNVDPDRLERVYRIVKLQSG